MMFSWTVGWYGGERAISSMTHFGQLDFGTTDVKVNAVGKGLCLSHTNSPSRLEKAHSFSPLKLLWWASLFVGTRAQLTDPFPAQFELSSLNGTNGFILNGEWANYQSGVSVSSAGDVNGDGLDDLVVGSSFATALGMGDAGKSYVIFGSRTVISGGTLDLSSLNGTNGFIINGEDHDDKSGHSVSTAGDVNGDGIDDLVIGAYVASPSSRYEGGKGYVVFGSRTIVSGGALRLSSLNGDNGFIINGELARSSCGYSVSNAGDINGDGLSDIVIGAPNAGIYGRSYVVYGTSSIISRGTFDLSRLNGQNGFILNGEAEGSSTGYSVSSAGDVNGDGLSDLVIGAPFADASGITKMGKSYVVFGSRNIVSGGILELSTLNGTYGYIIIGDAADDWSGFSVSTAGDFNGDGLSDILIGAKSDFRISISRISRNYLVFGSRKLISGGTLNLSSLNGKNGIILIGMAGFSGSSVSSAGDLNGDGLSDLVIGIRGADPSGLTGAGISYVVYGNRLVSNDGKFDVSSLNGFNGFVLNGVSRRDNSGSSVSSAGDLNGDGISDLVIGARFADTPRYSKAGKTYVVFGRNHTSSFQKPPPSMGITSSINITITSTTNPSIHYGATPQLLTTPSVLHETPSHDRSASIAGIVATVVVLASSLFAGGLFYFRKLRKGKEHEVFSTEEEGTSFGYMNPTAEHIERTSANSYNNHDLLTAGHQKNKYNEWPSEPQPSRPENYTSIDKIEKAHDDYVEDKMKKAQVHYSEIRH